MPMEGVSIFGTSGTIVNHAASYRENGDHDAEPVAVRFSSEAETLDFDGVEYFGHLLSVRRYIQEMEVCIEQNRSPVVNELDGAKCAAVSSACWESIKTGSVVKVFNEF